MDSRGPITYYSNDKDRKPQAGRKPQAEVENVYVDVLMVSLYGVQGLSMFNLQCIWSLEGM